MSPVADAESAQQAEDVARESVGTRENESEDSPAFVKGTVLEAAFVDPAYSWPPADGQGKNAIELQATSDLLKTIGDNSDEEEEEDVDLEDPVPPKIRRKVRVTTTTETKSRCGFFNCCKSQEAVVNTHIEKEPILPEVKERLKREYLAKKSKVQQKRLEKELKAQAKKKAKMLREKYARVPEGVLIYRLDTAAHTVTLVSGPSSNTNVNSLLTNMVVASVSPSMDKTRRGIMLTGIDGHTATLVACEQRTAISWLEAMDMMLGNFGAGRRSRSVGADGKKQLLDRWGSQTLNDEERDEIEEQYLSLAAYSNNLIRAGGIPGAKAKSSGGGIYYSVSSHREEGEDVDEETLESIAKRRAVIKDSWDFYRMICSLLRDRRKYDEVFRRMQLDPVYPYLNSMTGLNDPSDDGFENADKVVTQKSWSKYEKMTRTQICQDLVKRAEDSLPSLVEICKALAGSLGMEEVGVGPVKDVSSAIRKAEKKYDGDVTKVTDYCRALLVVKDFSTLLALLELARDSFGPLIRRVKVSTLKTDHRAMPGGYRDCKINLELKEHICEIQVHLWPMWVVCGIDGFRHYRHCTEYSTDSFCDSYDSLSGLNRKSMAELIVMAEEAVIDMPLDSLEWYHEKYILDYFAEVGLFLKHDLAAWAEVTLRQLIKLRCESPDIGPDHSETLYLKKYLEQALRLQHKKEEANDIAEELAEAEREKKDEKKEADKSLWESFFTDPREVFDLLMDPSKKEREEEERLKKKVRASKKAWRKIREKRFKFLDANCDDSHHDGDGSIPGPVRSY